jgi:hypothetical protein
MYCTDPAQLYFIVRLLPTGTPIPWSELGKRRGRDNAVGRGERPGACSQELQHPQHATTTTVMSHGPKRINLPLTSGPRSYLKTLITSLAVKATRLRVCPQNDLSGPVGNVTWLKS